MKTILKKKYFLNLFKIKTLFVFSFSLLSCGVKGKPLPPLGPPMLEKSIPNQIDMGEKSSILKNKEAKENSPKGVKPKKGEKREKK